MEQSILKALVSRPKKDIRTCLIYAKDVNNLIGILVDNKQTKEKEFHMPWNMDHKEDLKYFKDTTMGCACIMGYNTWLSLKKKPLEGRLNIIITNRHYEIESKTYEFSNDVKIVRSIEEAVQTACKYASQSEEYSPKIFFIGGKTIFDSIWTSVDEIYQTIIHASHEYIHSSELLSTTDIILNDIDESKYELVELRRRGIYTWERWKRF